MEHFSSGFRDTFKDKDVDEIEANLVALISRLVPSMDGRELSPVAKLPAKIFDLLQVGVRRTIELTEASIREMNRQSIAASYVLVRATLETTCLLFDAIQRVRAAVEKDDVKELDEIDTFLMDVLVGFKSKDWGFSEEFAARNVLTIIQRLSKQLGIDLMWFYEGLSEYAHPNYLGMLGTYQTAPSKGEFVVQFGPLTDERLPAAMNMVIGGLAIATQMMEMAARDHDEAKTRFALLAEREIHESGTWPAGVAYPVRRK